MLQVSGIALVQIRRYCEIDGRGMMQARVKVKPRHMSLLGPVQQALAANLAQVTVVSSALARRLEAA
jgi:hypothetical protein